MDVLGTIQALVILCFDDKLNGFKGFTNSQHMKKLTTVSKNGLQPVSIIMAKVGPLLNLLIIIH